MFTSKFFPLNRKNGGCPVCGQDDGGCRGSTTDPDFFLCRTNVDAKIKEIINGHICVKEAKGHTASFKFYKESGTDEAKRDRDLELLRLKKQREADNEKESLARKDKALSAKERHEYYTEILDQLNLDNATLKDLKRRGFSDEEVERSGIKSVKRWQRLEGEFPGNFPGIGGKNGDTLIVPGDGYLCPARNVDGLIIGLQVRLYKPIDGNRFRWLSSESNSVKTKEFDEVPLAVYIPSQIKNLNIQLVEGIGVKPFLAAERMGMITIGAAGGNHTASPETLKHTINTIQETICQIAENGSSLTNPLPEIKLRKSKEFLSNSGKKLIDIQTNPILSNSKCQKDIPDTYLKSQLRNSLSSTQGLTDTASNSSLGICISPDAGFALNPSVIRTLLGTTEWVKNNFPANQIYVFDWNQIHKSQGDIDELKDLSIIRKLKFDSFTKKYKGVFDAAKGIVNKTYQEWARKRTTLTADIIQTEKYLSIPQGIEKGCDILLIRKKLGGGKTEALFDYLKYLDETTLLVGYRNTLLYNSVDRADKKGLSALHIKEARENIDGHDVDFVADTSIKLWAGCADSYFKFNKVIEANNDYVFVHDEICSILNHLKGGGTLKGRQKQAIAWDIETIRNAKFTIMMDANLSDVEVEFIRSLFPEKRIKVLDSLSPIDNPRTFYFLETEKESEKESDFSFNPKYLPSQLVKIAKEKGKVLWISDSQRSCEIIEEILTANGHKHFRLDGKTSHEEKAKIFQSAPKDFILLLNLDSVSISPSGESGLSIDLYDYFDAVCFDIRGTVGVNTLTQLSARLRDTKVPIYVSCPEFVNMTSNPCPYAINRVKEVMKQRFDMFLLNMIEAEEELIDSNYVSSMFQEMETEFPQDKWFIEALKDAKKLISEHSNLKLYLKTALAQDGNRIIDLVDKRDETTYEETKEIKEKVKRREAKKVFDSGDITWEQAQELNKKDVNYDDKCKIRKAKIKHKLPGIEETPSWNADLVYAVDVDQPKFLDRYWRLKRLQNEDLAKATFKIEKKYGIENNSFTAKDVWSDQSIKIKAFKQLGIQKILEAESFSCKDDWVKDIVDEYYNNPEWFDILGISRVKQTFKPDGTLKDLKYVKTMLNRFLEYFGLKTELVKKDSKNRYYKVCIPEEIKEFIADIDKCLESRMQQIIEEGESISLTALAEKNERLEKIIANS